MPTPVATGRPTACEFSVFAGSPGMPRAPRIEPVRLATVCWTPDAIVEGACAADTLPRATDGDAPLTVPVLQGAIAETQNGKGHSVRFAYLVTANAAPPDTTRIVGRARCDEQGEIVEGSTHLLTQIDHLAPGESLADYGHAFSDRPFATAPEHCTIELQSLVGGPPPERTPLASWCIRADATTAGACE
jgi:hypothetical protein